MFQGSMVALVTPMTPNGALDEEKLRKLINMHVVSGTEAIVVNGTTGEAATLNSEEQSRIIRIALEETQNKIPIIAGTGTYCTAETIERTKKAMELGAAACLIIAPSCTRPTQEGLYRHYRAIAEAVPIPIILYNVPGRTCCDIVPETVARLASISNIVGIKEATGDLSRVRSLLETCGDNFELYSGDDASALMFMLQGGKGVISVTANVAPKAMHAMCKAALSGNARLAGELNTPLMALHKSLFVESNPIPVKWALQQLGWISEGIRLPLTPLAEQYHQILQEALKESGVI